MGIDQSSVSNASLKRILSYSRQIVKQGRTRAGILHVIPIQFFQFGNLHPIKPGKRQGTTEVGLETRNQVLGANRNQISYHFHMTLVNDVEVRNVANPVVKIFSYTPNTHTHTNVSFDNDLDFYTCETNRRKVGGSVSSRRRHGW